MSNKMISTKEQALLDKISRHKQQLATLQKKQQLVLGQLAYKHGLHRVDSRLLDAAFFKLAEELLHEPG